MNEPPLRTSSLTLEAIPTGHAEKTRFEYFLKEGQRMQEMVREFPRDSAKRAKDVK
jgi:hypothetical protein